LYGRRIAGNVNPILDLAGRDVADQLGELQRIARAFEGP